jgi:competence protein CoiA-like protein
MTLDKRRVQTAVIGDAESESPVVLPLEAIELDEFRHLHSGDTYWCGVWLGGCGQQLTTKLYTDRACHFAHHPHANTVSACRRKASGVTSADHLYIKQDMLRWLAEQDIHATADIQRDADGTVGGSVLFTSEDGTGLRVLLSDDQLTAHTAQNTSHVLVAEDLAEGLDRAVARNGYINTIRCVPDGTRRRVQIGTKTYEDVTWYDPSECELTPEGLSTPAVEEIHRLRATRRPLGVRTPKAPAQPAARPVVEHAATDPRSQYDRTLVMTELQQAVTDGRSLTKLRLCLERAEAATHSGATAEENELMRSAGDALLRLERGVGVQPNPVTKRSAAKPRTRLRNGPGTPGSKVVVPKLRIGPVGDTVPAPRQDRPDAAELKAKVAAATAARLEAAAEQDRARAAELKAAAAAVRGALKKMAREQATSSWAKLRSQLGSALPRLQPGEQAELLYQVDRDTPPDEPLLSTVLAVSDPGILPAFQQAAAHLGLDLPDDPGDLRDVLEADTETLHGLWRHR